MLALSFHIMSLSMDREDRKENKRDKYLDPNKPLAERVDIAVDQGMSEVYKSAGSLAFHGIGRGRSLPAKCGGKFTGTAKEFVRLCKEQREQENGIRSRKRAPRPPGATGN